MAGPTKEALRHVLLNVSGYAAQTTQMHAVTETLDPERVDRLLELLATDDAFRDGFAADPDRSLALLGYRGSIRLLPCLGSRELAPKSVIAEV